MLGNRDAAANLAVRNLEVARKFNEDTLGLTFERYDMPDTQRQGDIHVAGDMKVAWFKDPDGNILNIVSG